MSIKRVLVSHQAPTDENSPYRQLAREWGLEIDFMNFVTIQDLPTHEFRKQNINPMNFTAIIFTSKIAVDHYFRICRDLRIEMPPEMKYFCISDATAKYLQKYITIRKRKLYIGDRNVQDLYPLFKKYSKEKYLFPCGEPRNKELTDFMQASGLYFQEAIVYNTVPCDIRSIANAQYDLICFFSPNSVESLWSNFPNYQQNQTLVAVFGGHTARVARESGLRVDIEAPTTAAPSMTMAIDNYLKENKTK